MVESVATGGAVAHQSDGKDVLVDRSISVTGGEGQSGGASQKQDVKIVNEIGNAETNYLEEAAEGVKEPSYLKIRKGGY